MRRAVGTVAIVATIGVSRVRRVAIAVLSISVLINVTIAISLGVVRGSAVIVLVMGCCMVRTVSRLVRVGVVGRGVVDRSRLNIFVVVCAKSVNIH